MLLVQNIRDFAMKKLVYSVNSQAVKQEINLEAQQTFDLFRAFVFG